MSKQKKVNQNTNMIWHDYRNWKFVKADAQKKIHKIIKERTSGVLGHKDEPYYKTEKEMLQDKIYNYASLSETEKGIYKQLNNHEYRKSDF